MQVLLILVFVGVLVFFISKSIAAKQTEQSRVESITIPGGTTEIKNGEFRNFRKLKSITIPNSVTSIGRDAFCECSSLTSITIPNSVTSIGVGAFQCCSSLTSITIPDSVTSIGECAFEDCSSLTSITIGNGVTSIGNYAFMNCSSLTNIAIPDSLIKVDDGEYKKIGYGVFNGCTNLKSFNDNFASKKGRLLFISEDGRCLIAIGGNIIAFAPAGLTEYTIPDGIARIEECAFYGCKELTNIVIPNSVYHIGLDAFGECSRLKSFSGDLASKDGRCIIKNGKLLAFIPLGLTRYTIPDSVTHIEMQVFKFCDCLTDITIPEGVKRIGREAFSDCKNLKSITIPTSVEKIGAFAFYGCSSLTSINIPKGTDVHEDAFTGCHLDIEITEY